MNINEILSSWIIANNPSKGEQELAAKRIKICDTCEHKKTFLQKIKIATICNKCGCPLSKKVFSPKENPCPIGKWKEVDSEHFLKIQKKDNKTII